MALFIDYLRSTDLYRHLCQVHDSPEGNTLEIIAPPTAEAQIEFHRWALHEVRADAPEASEVLEIGFNKGLFSLLLGYIWPHAGVVAIDENPDAEEAANILNLSHHPVMVDFYPGRSEDVLEDLMDWFDYAWVAGSHDYSVALSDLKHCDRLGIPWVAVDDTAYESVAAAVAEWEKHTCYQEILSPFIEFDTRKARLFRRFD